MTPGPEGNKEKQEQSPALTEIENAAKKVNPDKAGKEFDNKAKLSEGKGDQQLGHAEEMKEDQIKAIEDFVEINDKLVTNYSINGIADGNKFVEGGPNAKAIRKECRDMIIQLGDKMVLPKEYQTQYLNAMDSTPANEVLALDRALVVLNQLRIQSPETFDKVTAKLARDIHTEKIPSGDFRTGSLSAYTDHGTFDMTENNKSKQVTEQINNKESGLAERRTEFKNTIPRIDFLLQTPNPENPKEILYFQKQVNTDGTSKSGWNTITATTYNFTKKHINAVDLGSKETSTAQANWIQNIRGNIVGKDGKYESILKELNTNEDKNKQVRRSAAQNYLATVGENPDPRLSAFVEKVEKSLGKGGFKTFVHDTFTLATL